MWDNLRELFFPLFSLSLPLIIFSLLFFVNFGSIPLVGLATFFFFFFFSSLNFTIFNMKVGSGNLFQLNYLCLSDGRGFAATLYAIIATYMVRW